MVEYQYAEKAGWRISKEPKRYEDKNLTNKQVADLAAKLASAVSFVQSGGTYGEGEYKTFTLDGKTYRYLSKQIDTKLELLNYLKAVLVPSAAEKFMNDRGIIDYKGKLAQIEADGGSLLQWDKSVIEYMKTDKNTKFYRLTVPVGDTNEKQVYIVEYQYVEKAGWRISKEPYWDLNVPGNVNPAFIFFQYLHIDSKVSQQQFLNPASFNVEEFKKGIKKTEFTNLVKIGHSDTQVEFLVKFKAELEKDYKGSLINGENMMYFTVQPAGYMEFKIDRAGMVKLY